MKTDRELLELAAKAAGVRHIEYTNDYDGARGLVMCDEHGRHGDSWRPLTDDGDALRLAAKLGLVISTDSRAIYVQTIPGVSPSAYASQGGPDQMESIRRAIVRAAAAIGEAMQ